MSNRVVRIRKNRNFPINSRSVYSFFNGNPNIDFELASDPSSLVDVRTMRLNFQLNIKKANGDRPNNANTRGTGATECQIDPRVATNSVIDVVRLSNLERSEVIEEVRSYSRLLASTAPVLTSFSAYQTWGSNKNNAFARQDTENLAVNGVVNCNLQIRTGLMNNGVPLSTALLGGLKISLQLSPDNYVLFGGNASDFHYEMSSVVLTYDTLVLERPMMPTADNFQYPAYASFLNTLASGDDQKSLMMNLGSVRSFFTNFIKTASLNNFTANSLETNRIKNNAGDDKEIQNLNFMRQNVKFPLKYDINERIVLNNATYPAFLNRTFLDAFRPYRNITSSLQSPATQGDKTIKADDYNQPDEKYIGGAGIRYDALNVGQGVDFKNAMFSSRNQNKLQDGTTNTEFSFALSNQGLKVSQQSVQPVM